MTGFRYPLNKKKILSIGYKNDLPPKVIVIRFLNEYATFELKISEKVEIYFRLLSQNQDFFKGFPEILEEVSDVLAEMFITHYSPVLLIYTPWGFLMFSGGIDKQQRAIIRFTAFITLVCLNTHSLLSSSFPRQ